jgi:hypothetical protein
VIPRPSKTSKSGCPPGCSVPPDAGNAPLKSRTTPRSFPQTLGAVACTTPFASSAAETGGPSWYPPLSVIVYPSSGIPGGE